MQTGIQAVDFGRQGVDPEGFARDLGGSFERYGFAVVSGHGLPQGAIDRCLACFRDFFDLPVDAKLRYHVPGSAGARGYTPFGIETAKGAEHHDLKEFWHVGRELPPGHRYRRYMPGNLWIDEIPGFRDATLGLW
jgi:isopenicillin N synthase-like dioxygenase